MWTGVKGPKSVSLRLAAPGPSPSGDRITLGPRRLRKVSETSGYGEEDVLFGCLAKGDYGTTSFLLPLVSRHPKCWLVVLGQGKITKVVPPASLWPGIRNDQDIF